MDKLIPSLPPLPDPPLLQRLVLESPMAPAITLAAIGLVGFFVANRRERAKTGLIWLAAFGVLAGGLLTVGARITTDRERLLERSRGLVQAAVRGDAKAAENLLDPEVGLALEGSSVSGITRSVLVQAFEGAGRILEPGSESLFQLDASVDGPNVGRSQFVVRVSAHGGRPNFTAWRMDWRKDGQGRWRTQRLNLLRINGRSPGSGFASRIRSLGG